MKKLLLILLCIIFLFSSLGKLNAQQYCGTAKLMRLAGPSNYYKQLFKSYQQSTTKARNSFTIPVVVHVVYNSSVENIPDSIIHQQIDILNNDFNRWNADTIDTPSSFSSVAGSMDITFCLARQTPNNQVTTGILRVATTDTSFYSPLTYAVPDPVKHDSSGGSDAWDPLTYLNIWICNLTGVLGYSAPPGNFLPNDEGIVCDFQWVGLPVNYPYVKGRIMTHEAGHYFGLKHIWGDDAGTCTGTDWINDTPNQANYSTACPTYPLTDSCSSTSPGVMFMNYMDYTTDACKNLFTKEQCSAMENCITLYRSGFLTAQGCYYPTAITNQVEPSPITITVKQGQIILNSTEDIKGSVQIFNSLGKLMSTANHGGKNIVLPTIGWAKGIYFVSSHVSLSAKPHIKKVIVW